MVIHIICYKYTSQTRLHLKVIVSSLCFLSFFQTQTEGQMAFLFFFKHFFFLFFFVETLVYLGTVYLITHMLFFTDGLLRAHTAANTTRGLKNKKCRAAASRWLQK